MSPIDLIIEDIRNETLNTDLLIPWSRNLRSLTTTSNKLQRFKSSAEGLNVSNY